MAVREGKNREKAESIFIFYIIIKKMLFGKSVYLSGGRPMAQCLLRKKNRRERRD